MDGCEHVRLCDPERGNAKLPAYFCIYGYAVTGTFGAIFRSHYCSRPALSLLPFLRPDLCSSHIRVYDRASMGHFLVH